MGKNKVKVVKKRSRKSFKQLQMLENELAKNREWTKEDIARIARATGLSEPQVYKWAWDQRQKQQSALENKLKNTPTLYELFQDIDYQSEKPKVVPRKSTGMFGGSSEILGLHPVDKDLIHVQKLYKLAVEYSLSNRYN